MEDVHSQMKKQKREENIIPISRMLNYFKIPRLRQNRIRRRKLFKSLFEEIKELVFKDSISEIPTSEDYDTTIKLFLLTSLPIEQFKAEIEYRFIKGSGADIVVMYVSVWANQKGSFWDKLIDLEYEPVEHLQERDLYEEVYTILCNCKENSDQPPIVFVSCFEASYKFFKSPPFHHDYKEVCRNFIDSPLKIWTSIWKTLY